jgi:O-methyltransferase involved in polyketide biosynthesis
LRSIKLLERGEIDDAIEFDLPPVVKAKNKLLHSKRFQRRRPHALVPSMVGVDLNQPDDRDRIFRSLPDDGSFSIFLLEGVIVHLQPGSGKALLELCSGFLKGKRQGCLVFADRLEDVDNRDLSLAQTELEKTGFQLVEWLANPTKTPHMGFAVPI